MLIANISKYTYYGTQDLGRVWYFDEKNLLGSVDQDSFQVKLLHSKIWYAPRVLLQVHTAPVHIEHT